jgi:hypothetical protein
MFKILKKGLSSHPYFLLTPCKVFCLGDLTKRTNVRDMGLLISLKDPEIRRQFCHFTSCRSYKVPWLSCLQAADGFVSPQQRVQCSLDLAPLVIHCDIWMVTQNLMSEYHIVARSCTKGISVMHYVMNHLSRNLRLGDLVHSQSQRSGYHMVFVICCSPLLIFNSTLRYIVQVEIGTTKSDVIHIMASLRC